MIFANEEERIDCALRILSKVLAALRRSGGKEEDVRRFSMLPEQDLTWEIVASLGRDRQPVLFPVINVPVNYRLSIDQLIGRHEFLEVHPEITDNHFPIGEIHNGTGDAQFFPWVCEEEVDSEKAVACLDSKQARPSTILEMLFFLEVNYFLKIDFLIAALGSQCCQRSGEWCVPCCVGGRLWLFPWKTRWPARSLLLGVKQPHGLNGALRHS